MTIPSDLDVLIARSRQELQRIEQDATRGVELVRLLLERFPNNFNFIQLLALLSSSLLFVQTSRTRLEAIQAYLSGSEDILDEKIQEIGEDLAIDLGKILETKIRIGQIKSRLENLS